MTYDGAKSLIDMDMSIVSYVAGAIKKYLQELGVGTRQKSFPRAGTNSKNFSRGTSKLLIFILAKI